LLDARAERAAAAGHEKRQHEAEGAHGQTDAGHWPPSFADFGLTTVKPSAPRKVLTARQIKTACGLCAYCVATVPVTATAVKPSALKILCIIGLSMIVFPPCK